MPQPATRLIVEPALIEQATRLVFGKQNEYDDTSDIRMITKESLHNAFRKRALAFHPDRADQLGIEAIAWQMQVRPKIGEIGRAYRFLDHDTIFEVIKQRKTGELFGNVALRTGRVTRLQLLAMIGKQKSLNLPIGRYFVDEDYFSREELESLIQKNNLRNAWFRRNG